MSAQVVVLEPTVEQKLDDARQRVADFVAAVPDQGDVEVALAGAGRKFLSATELSNVAAKMERQSERRRNDPKLDEGWVTLRFRITPEQRDVVYAAIDKAIEMAGKDKSGAYKGWGLEMVCADFLAGHSIFLGSRGLAGTPSGDPA